MKKLIVTLTFAALFLTPTLTLAEPKQRSWAPQCPKHQQLVCTMKNGVCLWQFACRHTAWPKCDKGRTLKIRNGVDWCVAGNNANLYHPSKCPKHYTRVYGKSLKAKEKVDEQLRDRCVFFRTPHFVVSKSKTVIGKFFKAVW